MILTADYYDISNNYYYRALASLYKSQRLRIDFLDHQENTLYRVEQDIDSSDAGKIVNNNEQGTRRSFSFNLINVNGIYNLLDENTFWFNRKFRVYLGIAYQDDTFWFSKGVYITQNATLDSMTKTVSLNGVDKYAQLDGTLNVLQADEIDTVFEVGSKISNVIHDILMLDIGNGMVLDPVEPIIDPDIGNQKLYKEFTMSAGSYYGDFLTEIMTSFGCDIFYDTMGRLTVRRIFNDDRPYWYAFKSPAYNFVDEIWGYQSPQITIDMKGINKITVSTENVNYPNVSETVINNNPRSPLCASKIGRRTFTENGGVIYISLGDETIDTPETKCREYAEYRLMQETCLALEASFQCPPLYHLCEGDVITITDSALGFDQESFIINSITISAGTDSMSVTATNLKYLPTDIYNDAIYTYIFRSPSHPSYTLSYSLVNGSGTTPSPLVTKISCPFTPATGYDKTTHVTMFNASSGNADLKSWTGSNAFEYEIGKTYTKPMSDLTLYANYVSYANGITSVVPTSAISNKTISRVLSARGSHYIEAINASGKTYYFKGRGQDNDSFTLSFSPNTMIKHYTDSTNLDESSPAQLLNDIDGGSYIIVTFPSQLETLSFVEYPLEASVIGMINFPANLSLLRCSGDFLGGNYSSPASIGLTDRVARTYEGTSGSSMFSNNTTLTSMISNLEVTIRGLGIDGTLFASRVPLYTVQLNRTLTIENADVLNYAQHLGSGESYTSGDGWDRIPSNAGHKYLSVSILEKGSFYCGDTYYNTQTGQDEIVGSSNVAVRLTNALILGDIDGEVASVGDIRVFNDTSIGQFSINNIYINNVCTAFSNMIISRNHTFEIAGELELTRPKEFFRNVSGINTLVIKGGTKITSNLDGGSVDSIVMCENPDLTTVIFQGATAFNCSDGEGSIRLLCDNPNLTTVQFQTSGVRFTVDGNGTYDLFKNNNPNFAIVFANGSAVDQDLIDYLDVNSIPYSYS